MVAGAIFIGLRGYGSCLKCRIGLIEVGWKFVQGHVFSLTIAVQSNIIGVLNYLVAGTNLTC